VARRFFFAPSFAASGFSLFVIPTGVPRFVRHSVEGSRHEHARSPKLVIPSEVARRFFFAPYFGAPGHVARFVRPVRFADTEGSLLDFNLLSLTQFLKL
jgi:hypothetical protein